MLNSFFRFLGAEESPTKVLEVRSDNYISRPILYREDSMILYAPKIPVDNKNPKDKFFEIVLQKPFTETLHHMYSLFRSENSDISEERFAIFKDKIPLYIKVTKECTIPTLQRLCDTLSEHQTWTIAHIVAHFGLYELFNDSDVQKHIDDQDSLTGITPIMVAVQSCNIRMVQSLISLKCSLRIVDYDGNTVFHYAAASNKEIINALANSDSSSLNIYNKQGYTPLHTACLADAPDCVRALLLSGADVNLAASQRTSSAMPGIVGDLLKDKQPKLHQQDMKHGGTPLHWAISREVIEALVDKNCDINALNFDDRTALHIMVLRGRLECAVALLSQGAQHSTGDKDGNTPLHLAVKQTNIAIVQALIVFGAKLEAKNKEGLTPRHCVPAELSSSNYDKILYVLHAVGAKRCPTDMSGCRAGCSTRGEYNGVPPPPVARASTRKTISDMLSVAGVMRAANNNEDRQARLLCLDGGGIRGLVLIQILINLEEAVGKPIINCFDWVAGTSTGGILALALSCGKSLRDCQRLYFRMKEHAFVGIRPYPSEALENMLKENLGTETVMSDIKHPKLCILAVLADRKPVDLHLFRNYRSAQDILDEHNGTLSPRAEASDQVSVVSLPPPPPPDHQLVWQAARASGAAPSYFRASGRYLDGGLIGNNPTLDALTELAEVHLALTATGQHEEAKKANLKVVVSCGTGLIPVTKLKDFDVFKPESLWDTARLACGLSAIGGLLVDQATQSDGRVVERARAWCSSAGVHYFRFSPQMSRDVAMDERLDDRLVLMLWEAHAFMWERRDEVKELVSLLR
ncbi:85/88 kDa calcium-independent phospholipase A2 isoform X2 [Plodia interpunctella]|uniref:85/88 kDa calcium-independent phospholipase A2 isoform X2 n=1 Tax=Plodia interpunctella TaxID=58824 RepID=UPI002367BE70|nr:85/88 kDa calcium-independent phospholipase A2 isoform X2 [Plodia interpunctella]